MKRRPVNTGKMARDRAKRPQRRAERSEPSLSPRQFVNRCREVLEKADELPERAADFQEGVTERLQSMADWAEENSKVTAKMIETVENIDRGIDRWLEREDVD
jgi:hypothetical protein